MSKRGARVQGPVQVAVDYDLIDCAQGRAAFDLIWVSCVTNIIPPRSSVELSLREQENARGESVQARVWDTDVYAQDAAYALTGETPVYVQQPTNWLIARLRDNVEQALTPDENVQE